MRPLLAILAILLASAPPAGAQTHEHEEGAGIAMVLHDGPDDGRAVAGAFTHFGFALLENGAPQPHRNAEITVRHNGQALFATTDSHEYDGIFSLDLVFPTPGVYEVEATSEGMRVGTFSGVVVAPVDETVARVELDAAPSAAASRAVDVTLSIVDANGTLLPHTDAVIEFRHAQGDALVARVHAHIHDEPIRLTQALPLPGAYVATVVAHQAFQTGRSADVRPVLGVFPIEAGPLPPGAAAPTPEALAGARPLQPIGENATSGGLTLHGGYDPQPLVGVGNPTRLSALLVDANGTPVAHADFAFRLEGPDGLVFSSESLHEYDGAFEHVFTPSLPGAYAATLTATRGDTTLEIDYLVQAAPPVAPLDPGAFDVTVRGLDGAVAGTPMNLTFAVAGPTGPLKHSEVDVAIFRDGEPPVYQFKLHTHASGESAATVVLPTGGEWRVAIDPIPLMPQASLVERTVLVAQVADGALPEPVLPLGGADADAARLDAPGAGAALVVAAACAAALALARRRRG